MLSFHTKYRPLTSRPFLSGPAYAEYDPCEALRPYVVCFWGAQGGPASGKSVLVIPDTCVDIIIEINHTRQKMGIRLCGIQDAPYIANRKAEIQADSSGGLREIEETTTFAVRFHFWSVSLFLKLDMREIYNRSLDLDYVLPGCSRDFSRLFYMDSMEERIKWMEDYLLRILDCNGYNSNLYNSIGCILHSSGRAGVKEICRYSCVSQRQMERLFMRDIGVSVKRAACLVRYQSLWRDMVGQKNFQVQEAVYRYGYTDQSHLLNEFKRFHGVTPGQAKQIAMDSR